MGVYRSPFARRANLPLGFAVRQQYLSWVQFIAACYNDPVPENRVTSTLVGLGRAAACSLA